MKSRVMLEFKTQDAVRGVAPRLCWVTIRHRKDATLFRRLELAILAFKKAGLYDIEGAIIPQDVLMRVNIPFQ